MPGSERRPRLHLIHGEGGSWHEADTRLFLSVYCHLEWLGPIAAGACPSITPPPPGAPAPAARPTPRRERLFSGAVRR